MTAAEEKEESPNQSFCLFHEKTECSCDVPVPNKATLIYRLIQEIKANEFLILNSSNAEKKAKIQIEINAFQERLDKLTNVF